MLYYQYSDEFTYYHLVPGKGWVEGSYKIDFQPVTKRPRPKNRVLTIKYISQGDAMTLSDRIVVTFKSQDNEKVTRLVRKYGSRPSQLG